MRRGERGGSTKKTPRLVFNAPPSPLTRPTTALPNLTTLAFGRTGTHVASFGLGDTAAVVKTTPRAAAAAAEGAAAHYVAAADPGVALAVYAAFATADGRGCLVLERAAVSARAAARRAGGFLLEPDAASAVRAVARALEVAHDAVEWMVEREEGIEANKGCG